MKPKVSCCMIVRDEGESIAAAVRSVLPAVSEFVIGVDSRTTDKTREIARAAIGDECALDLYDFEWRDDFSAARNEGIERATGDWILILDGHETFRPEGVEAIRDVLTKADGQLDQIYARLCHRPDEYGNPGDFSHQARLFRKASGVLYKHAHHNMLPMPAQNRVAACPQIVVDHAQPEGRAIERAKQNKDYRPAYFQALVEQNPQDHWARYYLGAALEATGEVDKALVHWEYIIDHASPQSPRWLPTLVAVAESLRAKGEHIRAVEMLKRAWPTFMDRREPYILMGRAHRAVGNIGESVRYLNIAAHMAEPFLPHQNLSGPAYTWLPFKELAESYLMAGQLEASAACAERALEFRPGDAALQSIADSIAKGISERLKGRRPKVVYLVDQFGSFSGSIASYLGEHNRVITDQKYAGPVAEHADVVFVDWCDMNAIAASRNTAIRRLVIRFRSYEAYSNMPTAVDWDNVDAVIFPAEHIQRFANERFNLGAHKRLKQYHIRNPVDTGQFQPADVLPAKKVAWLGYLNWKKGIPLLFEVARMNPDYDFIVGGKFQDLDTRRYFETKLPSNVVFDGWVEDVPSWLADKMYILNTSLREGLPNAVLQGMAMGLTPIVHAWPGAEDGFPDYALFNDATEVRAMLGGPIEPEQYRKWVVDRHDAQAQLPKLASAILGEPQNE